MFTILVIYFYLVLLAIAIQTQRGKIKGWLYLLNLLPIALSSSAGLLKYVNLLSSQQFRACLIFALVSAWLIRPLNGQFIFHRVNFSHLLIHGIISTCLIFFILK